MSHSHLRLATGVLAVSLAITPAISFSQQVQPRLRAAVEVQDALETGESVMVRFMLTNESTQDLRFLKWNTPLEGIRGRIFRVERDGETVLYEGVLVRRGDPLPDDYVVIPAGGSVEAEVDLAGAYDFSSAGAYSIQFLSPVVSDARPATQDTLATLAATRRIEIPSPPASVRINRSIERAPRERPARLEARSTVINSCSSAEETAVEDADFAANFWSVAIQGHLEGLSSTERQTYALYQVWFGAYTGSRYATVLDNWQKLEDAFNYEEITYDCSRSGCSASDYAYVYVGGPNEVFLCGLFFSSSTTGYYSQATTLIHELSHEAAGTDDNAYGTTNCQNLATNDPASAIDNADNYAFFMEDYRLATTDGGAPKVIYSLLLLSLILVLAAAKRFWSQQRLQRSRN